MLLGKIIIYKSKLTIKLNVTRKLMTNLDKKFIVRSKYIKLHSYRIELQHKNILSEPIDSVFSRNF